MLGTTLCLAQSALCSLACHSGSHNALRLHTNKNTVRLRLGDQTKITDFLMALLLSCTVALPCLRYCAAALLLLLQSEGIIIQAIATLACKIGHHLAGLFDLERANELS